MVIDLRSFRFDLTPPLRTHVEDRLGTALRRFSRDVLRVTVRLDDINGDHGGCDKRCTLVASLARRGTVVAEAIDRNLYAGIGIAVNRLRGSLGKVLARPMVRERKGQQRHGALWQSNGHANVRCRPDDEQCA